MYYMIKSTLVLHADSPPIRKVFRLHAATVFEGITHPSNAASSTTAPAESQHGVRSLRDALRDIDSSDDDDGNGCHSTTSTSHANLPANSWLPALEYETFNLEDIVNSESDSDPTPAVLADVASAEEELAVNGPPILQAEGTPVNLPGAG